MWKYSGEWYEISSDWWFPAPFLGGDCTKATYTPIFDGTITVLNETYTWFAGDFAMEGAAIVSDTGDASLNVEFGDVPSASATPNYTVLSTDYETYAVVYSCDNEGWYANDYFWILSRTPELSDDKMLEILAIVAEKLPSYDYFNTQVMTRQDDTCFWA